MTNFYVETGSSKKTKGKKYIGSRLFAILILVLCVSSLVILPYNIIKVEGDGGIKSVSMFSAFTELLKNPSQTFDMLPGFDIAGRTGDFYNLAIYLFMIFCVIATVVAFFAIFSKKAPFKGAHNSLFFLGAGELGYSLAFTVAADQLKGRGYDITSAITEVFASFPYTLEVLSLGLGLACLLLWLFTFSRKKDCDCEE